MYFKKPAFLLLHLCILISCTKKRSTDTASQVVSEYLFSLPSEEDLLQSLKNSLNARDIDSFKKYFITRSEFHSLVFPHFPDGEREMGVDNLWLMIGRANARGIRSVRADIGGCIAVSGAGIKFVGKIKEFNGRRAKGPYEVSFFCKTKEGKMLQFISRDLISSILEDNGRYKVFGSTYESSGFRAIEK